MSKPLREGQISEDGFVGVVFFAVFVIFVASVAPKAQSVQIANRYRSGHRHRL